MSGKKGMLRYSEEIKQKIRWEHEKGASIKGLSRKYDISRGAIHSWCGLSKTVEMWHAAPLPKGRPRKQQESQEQIIKRLRIENELLRNFLSAVGRR
jgi:transposase